jgi:hypothetical protein
MPVAASHGNPVCPIAQREQLPEARVKRIADLPLAIWLIQENLLANTPE